MLQLRSYAEDCTKTLGAIGAAQLVFYRSFDSARLDDKMWSIAPPG